MPSALQSSPRTEVKIVARLALASALLWLACSEAPQGGDEALPPRWIEPQALQAASGAQWNYTSALSTAPYGHTATLLPSGKVLVTGGQDTSGAFASTEVYDPATGAWSSTGDLTTAREEHTATLLLSGKVLVTGGWGSSGSLASAEVYDPATGVWSPTGSLATARYGHTATLLPSGMVLVTGGRGSSAPLTSAEVYDPATGVWSPTGSLATARVGHTATLLPSGKVLVTGGSDLTGASLASAEVYDPDMGVWSPTSSLATARYGHTATLLPSGKVLVTGGSDLTGASLASAEVYDPVTWTWSPTAPLTTARRNHTATLLPSGMVLVTGGWGSSGFLASAEMYDPDMGAWSPTGDLTTARVGHTATLLPSGKVLVTRGSDSSGFLASAEVYDLATGAWSSTGALATARVGHTATLLPSGKVLVTGGSDPTGASLASGEVYDPATGAWRSTSALTTAREDHTATLLLSGKVLVTGGWGSNGFLASAEVYDPDTGAWSPTGALTTARYGHTATLLPSGMVLVTGGWGSSGPLTNSEVYDPATGVWNPTGALTTAREDHTATLLPSGKVLVTGGYSSPRGRLTSAEVYDPALGVWSPTSSLTTARGSHTATLLPSGKVLVTGGSDPRGFLASAEVYDPATEAWSPTGALATARDGHTATLLPSGQVLVTGGWGSNGLLASAEVYDPATGTWSPTGALATARGSHTATLVPSGKVLVTSGYGPSDFLASTEEYADTGAREEWRPVIAPPAEQQPGETFRIAGSRLRGLSEASSGNTQSSATNIPVVSLKALEEGKLTHVTVLDSFSDTEVTVRTPLVPNGYYILSVTANAIQGGQLVRVNKLPPGVPEFTSRGEFVNTPTPVITGTAEPGSTVTVSLDGDKTRSGTVEVDAAGDWSFTPGTALLEGLHQATATAKDKAGNVSPTSVARSFTVDTVPPATPAIVWPKPLVNTLNPVIAGTTEPGSTVTVFLDGAIVGMTAADATGAWSFLPYTALPEGVHQARATAEDKAGNVSPPSEARSFTVDTIPPATPVVTSPRAFINISTPAIRGTAEAGSAVTLFLDGAVTETAVADATGAWSFIPGAALPEGVHQARAIAKDKAGNVSPPSEASFTVDTIPPATPVVTSPGAFFDTPIIRGTAEPGSTVELSLDGAETKAAKVPVNAAGDWLFSPTTALDLGDHSVSVTAMDAAGNLSAPSQQLFSVQKRRSHYGWSCTTAPAVPATWALLLLALSLRKPRSLQPSSAGVKGPRKPERKIATQIQVGIAEMMPRTTAPAAPTVSTGSLGASGKKMAAMSASHQMPHSDRPSPPIASLIHDQRVRSGSRRGTENPEARVTCSATTPSATPARIPWAAITCSSTTEAATTGPASDEPPTTCSSCSAL